MTFTQNIRSVFLVNTEEEVSQADSGDLVQTVLITAGFAVSAIMVVAWYANTIAARGSQVANCMATPVAYDNGTEARDTCDNTATSSDAAKANEQAYYERFGAGTPGEGDENPSDGEGSEAMLP